MIFDKTGTLTEGACVLRQTVTPEADADDALRRVASAEVKSDHFLAREIVKAARQKSMELEEVLSFEPVEGLGIIARTRSGEVIAGARRLMLDCGLEFSDDSGTGRTLSRPRDRRSSSLPGAARSEVFLSLETS